MSWLPFLGTLGLGVVIGGALVLVTAAAAFSRMNW